MRLVIALGGNALLHRGEPPEATIETGRLAAIAPALVRLIRRHQVILVHGNGPQIGLLARQSDRDSTVRPYPLGLLGAQTQGLIGSMIQQALRGAGLRSPTATLVTHALVAADDPALRDPDKFIGAVYSRKHAHELARAHGWSIAADGAGWRRVVPSPAPRAILELDAGRALIERGTAVIMGGGGGVPLLVGFDGQAPVDAVIDKDRTAAFIAEELDADMLVILTDVPGVIAGFGAPDATTIDRATPAALRALTLPAGSMGPKVDAACAFVDATGHRAAIGPLERAEDTVAGTAGTQIMVQTATAATAG